MVAYYTCMTSTPKHQLIYIGGVQCSIFTPSYRPYKEKMCDMGEDLHVLIHKSKVSKHKYTFFIIQHCVIMKKWIIILKGQSHEKYGAAKEHQEDLYTMNRQHFF
jgi:hypothetical protein